MRATRGNRPVSVYAGDHLNQRKWVKVSDLPIDAVYHDRQDPDSGGHTFKKLSQRTAQNLTLAKKVNIRKRDHGYIGREFATSESDREFLLARLTEWQNVGTTKLGKLVSSDLKSMDDAVDALAQEVQVGVYTAALVKAQLADRLLPLLRDDRTPDEQVAELRMIVLENLATCAQQGVLSRYSYDGSIQTRDHTLRAWGLLADWLLCPFMEKQT